MRIVFKFDRIVSQLLKYGNCGQITRLELLDMFRLIRLNDWTFTLSYAFESSNTSGGLTNKSEN